MFGDAFCGTCVFWDRFYGYDSSTKRVPKEDGKCRFSAPVFKRQASYEGAWPTTNQDDWCGKYISGDSEDRQ